MILKKLVGILLILGLFSGVAVAQTRWSDATKQGWYLNSRPLEFNLFSGPLKLESPLYATAGFNIVTSGSAPVNSVGALKSIDFTDVVADTQTVTIGTRVYEFDTNSSVTSGRVAVDVSGGVTPSMAATALALAITEDTSAVVSATVQTEEATATDVVALVEGVVGNSIALAETCTNGAWAGGAVLLSGGVDGTVGEAGEVRITGSYLYYTPTANTIADDNWVRATLASF